MLFFYLCEYCSNWFTASSILVSRVTIIFCWHSFPHLPKTDQSYVHVCVCVCVCVRVNNNIFDFNCICWVSPSLKKVRQKMSSFMSKKRPDWNDVFLFVQYMWKSVLISVNHRTLLSTVFVQSWVPSYVAVNSICPVVSSIFACTSCSNKAGEGWCSKLISHWMVSCISQTSKL